MASRVGQEVLPGYAAGYARRLPREHHVGVLQVEEVVRAAGSGIAGGRAVDVARGADEHLLEELVGEVEGDAAGLRVDGAERRVLGEAAAARPDFTVVVDGHDVPPGVAGLSVAGNHRHLFAGGGGHERSGDEVAVHDAELEGSGLDAARTEVIRAHALGLEPDELLALGVGRAVRRNRPDRVRGTERVAAVDVALVAPSLDGNRAVGQRAVVDEIELDDRHRVFDCLVGVESRGHGEGGVGSGAVFGVVRPAVAVEVERRVVDAARRIVHAVDVAGLVLRLPAVARLVVVAEELAQVQLAELLEVVERAVAAGRVLRVDVREVEHLANQVFGVIGETVAVVVGAGVVALEVVELQVAVVDGRVERIDAPRVGGRVAFVVFVNHGEAAAVRRIARVVRVGSAHPRRDLGVRRRGAGCGVGAGRAEHHIELPAVRDAVAVGVDRVGLERVLLPVVRLGCHADCLEVARHERLVERRERLGVHARPLVRGDRRVGRARIEAVGVVDLRVHERDSLARTHLQDAPDFAVSDGEFHADAPDVVALSAVHVGVAHRQVRRSGRIDYLADGRNRPFHDYDLAHAFAAHPFERHNGTLQFRIRHHVALQRRVGVGRPGVCADFTFLVVRDAVAVSVFRRRVGAVLEVVAVFVVRLVGV